MNKGLQVSDRLGMMPFFANVPFLRDYDDYVLDCKDAVFAYHLMQCISKYGLVWTRIPAGNSRCRVRFCARTGSEKHEMVDFLKSGEQRLLGQIRFPWQMKAASAELKSDEKGGCAKEAALVRVNKDALEQEYKTS